MTAAPPRWSTEELQVAAETSSEQFRAQRLAVTGAWGKQYKDARAKFERLFSKLGNVKLDTITDRDLAEIFEHHLDDALRYLAGPPISADDLRVLAGVDSLSLAALQGKPDALRTVYRVIASVIDPYRFPWTATGGTPSASERDAALLASSVLLAAQRIATERRNDSKDEQEKRVKDYLRDQGFVEARPTSISTIVQGPAAGEFFPECQLGERKADVVVRLHDTRLMALECKVSNSATNSVKRLNNDAAVKARYWITQFGTAQVVPAAVLAGVFKVRNLQQAQERGLTVFWSHNLQALGAFIASTR